MKTLKTAVLAGVMAVASFGAAHADTLTITGDVQGVNTAFFDAATEVLVTDLRTAVTSLTIGTLTINNNDPQGFKVSITSEQAGKLVRHNGTSYEDATKAGNYVSYSLALTHSSGTLGASEPAGFVAPTLSATAVGYDFNTNVTQGTVNKVYTVSMSRAAASQLFTSGAQDYKDVVTISIDNL